MTDSHEATYLAELIFDFPPQEPLPVAESLRDIQFIYDLLLDRTTTPAIVFPSFSQLPCQLHQVLYQNIVSNAGIYRQIDDPKRGVVYFGAGQKFRGTSPNKIAVEVDAITATLIANDETPIETIVSFYQRFVQIHPFYDANGRIGRVITNIYLGYYGYHMSWDALHANSKWLKRLNDCHKRYGGELYTQYLSYLVAHWRKFISQPAILQK